jgi:pyruvate/2-oxoglutarate dehydrogenase complex dihydrolipoamide acyltransferase (E2) component
MNYKEITIPQIDVNDEKVTIEDIVFADGAYVKKDEIIFTVSTAKAVEDFICEFEGYITYLVEDGDEVKIGASVSIIFDTKEMAISKSNAIKLEKESVVTVNASKKAIKFADEISFDLTQIKKNGVIKVKDIEEFLEKKGD